MHFLKYLTIALCLPLQLMAGGVILYEISSADTRLASAGWAARAQDPSTLFTNPAGMSRLCGTQLEVGAQPIFCHLTFDPQKGTEVKGGDGHANKWLPSGSSFYVAPYDECLTFGIGALGYFGSDLHYNSDWVGRYYVQKVLLEALSVVPAAAYRINEQWSVGAGLNVMYGFFKQQTAVRNGLDNLPDGFLRASGYRFGFGGVFGLLFEMTPCTRFGIQYLTAVNIDFKAKPHFHDIGPILNYLLTTHGVKNSRLDLGIKVPQGVMLSFYHDLDCAWSLMGNVGWQEWSRFEQVTLTLADVNSTTLTSKIKYKDTWHVAGGVEWHCCDALTLSGGIAYDSSAVSNKERPLQFPIGRQWRFGTGARWIACNNLILDFSTELQWQGKLKADVSIGPNVGRVVGNFKNAYVLFTSLNVTWVF